jgi:hypothetical protein
MFGVSVLLAAVMIACGGGGNDSPIDPSDPGGGDPGSSFSSSPPAPGEPADLDWARLAGELGKIASESLRQSLPVTSSSASVGAFDLAAPSSAVNVSAGFFCCGGSNASFLNVVGTVQPAGNGLTVALNLSSSEPLQWASSSGSGSWTINTQGSPLQVAGTLTASGGRIAQVQELRLAGSLRYTLASGEARTGTVDLALGYQNFEQGQPSASGTIGNLTGLQGRPLPSTPDASRCSRPQEGCGSGVSGPCPCTKWPICPGYGISCGPS